MVPVAGRLAGVDPTTPVLYTLTMDRDDTLVVLNALGATPHALGTTPAFNALRATLFANERERFDANHPKFEQAVRDHWVSKATTKLGSKPTRAPKPVPTVIGRQYEDGRVRYVETVVDRGFSYTERPDRAKVFRSRNAAHNAVRDRMSMMTSIRSNDKGEVGKFTDFFTRPASEVANPVGTPAPAAKSDYDVARRSYVDRTYIPGCPCSVCVRKRNLGAR